MIIKKIIYNNGKNEGYFIETRKGHIQVMIKEGEAFKLQGIKKISEIRVNEATLKVEEIKNEQKYIN